MPARKTEPTDNTEAAGVLPLVIEAPDPGEFKPAPHVIAAIARVEAAIGGIGKTSPKGSTLGYAYRGIDAITAAAQPLFGREGVVICPTKIVIDEREQITIKGNPWQDVYVTVLWTIYGPGGLQDSFTAETLGVGRDNAEKHLNKATTMAYKNLVLKLLSIGDPQDDADQPEHQRNYADNEAPAETPRPPDPPISPEEQQAREIYDAIRGLNVDDKAIFTRWIDSIPKPHPKLNVPDMTANAEWRQKILDAVGQIKLPVASPLGSPVEEVDEDGNPLDDGLSGLGESNYEGDA